MHVTHVYFCQGIQKRGQNFCPQEKIFRKKSDEGVLKGVSVGLNFFDFFDFFFHFWNLQTLPKIKLNYGFGSFWPLLAKKSIWKIPVFDFRAPFCVFWFIFCTSSSIFCKLTVYFYTFWHYYIFTAIKGWFRLFKNFSKILDFDENWQLLKIVSYSLKFRRYGP